MELAARGMGNGYGRAVGNGLIRVLYDGGLPLFAPNFDCAKWEWPAAEGYHTMPNYNRRGAES